MGPGAQNGFNCPDISQSETSRQSYLAAGVNDYGAGLAHSCGCWHGLKALWIDLRGGIGDASPSKAV
jgi:hypothetical protein